MALVAPIITQWTGLLRWCLLGALPLLLVMSFFVFSRPDSQEEKTTTRRYRMQVQRAISGHSIKLKTDERFNYAGIRAPYKHEPFHAEAKAFNNGLVNGHTVRVRYDKNERDRKGRLLGYVSVDGSMVNEMLVREGLAYVRLTPDTRRFADLLLAAQSEARKRRRGIWSLTPRKSEKSYPADPKYGNFHRHSCRETNKINKHRLVVFSTLRRALDAGYAPCGKCMP